MDLHVLSTFPGGKDESGAKQQACAELARKWTSRGLKERSATHGLLIDAGDKHGVCRTLMRSIIGQFFAGRQKQTTAAQYRGKVFLLKLSSRHYYLKFKKVLIYDNDNRYKGEFLQFRSDGLPAHGPMFAFGAAQACKLTSLRRLFVIFSFRHPAILL